MRSAPDHRQRSRCTSRCPRRSSCGSRARRRGAPRADKTTATNGGNHEQHQQAQAASHGRPRGARVRDGGRRRHRRRERRGGDDQLVAHPEQRSWQHRLAEHGRRVHGRAPERDDQHHGDGERGVQGRRSRPTCKRATFPTCSSRGAAAVCATRSRPASCRTSPTPSPDSSATSTRAPPGCTRSTACSTAPLQHRAWSASGTTRTSSTQAGITATADDVGRAARRRADAQGRRDHADRRRRRRQVAGPLLVLVPDGPPRRRRGDEPDRRRQQLRRARQSSRPARRWPSWSRWSRSRRASSAPDGTRPTVSPARWPARRGDGPDGPVGAWVRSATRPDSPRSRIRRCRSSIGWFPFPAVDGGAGAADRRLRRRRRVRRRARTPRRRPSSSSTFITNVENQRTLALSGTGIPANVEATAAVTEAPAADGPVMQSPRRAQRGAVPRSCSSTSSSRPRSVPR